MLKIETELWEEINSDYLYYIMFRQSFSIMSVVRVLGKIYDPKDNVASLPRQDKNSSFRRAGVQQSLTC